DAGFLQTLHSLVDAQPASVAHVEINCRVRVLAESAHAEVQRLETLLLLLVGQTLLEVTKSVRLEDHNSLVVADTGGHVADPALVLLEGLQTTLRVLTAVAERNVISDHDRDRACGLCTGDEVLDRAEDVRVPAAHPERLGLLRDTIQDRRRGGIGVL